MNRKAFTLIEILIVVVVLGILAAIVVPQFITENTRRSVAKQAQTSAVVQRLLLGEEVPMREFREHFPMGVHTEEIAVQRGGMDADTAVKFLSAQNMTVRLTNIPPVEAAKKQLSE